jgi:hypothetical protein
VSVVVDLYRLRLTLAVNQLSEMSREQGPAFVLRTLDG